MPRFNIRATEDRYLTKPEPDPEFQKYLQKLARRKELKIKAKEFGKKFLKGLLIAGVVCIAASSPYFLTNLLRAFLKYDHRQLRRAERKKLSDMFSDFRRRGLVRIHKAGKQIYISLTEEGKKQAKHYQIDDLVITKPEVWDKKWRVLIFDIAEKTRIKREALRGKLKELGFTKLQKSVWIHPYPCARELLILREFFGFRKSNYLFFETDYLGKDEQDLLKKYD